MSSLFETQIERRNAEVRALYNAKGPLSHWLQPDQGPGECLVQQQIIQSVMLEVWNLYETMKPNRNHKHYNGILAQQVFVVESVLPIEASTLAYLKERGIVIRSAKQRPNIMRYTMSVKMIE